MSSHNECDTNLSIYTIDNDDVSLAYNLQADYREHHLLVFVTIAKQTISGHNFIHYYFTNKGLPLFKKFSISLYTLLLSIELQSTNIKLLQCIYYLLQCSF